MARLGRRQSFRPKAGRLGAPVVLEVGSTIAAAQVALVTATASDPSVSIAPHAGVASASASASNPMAHAGRIVNVPAAASASVSAYDAVVYIIMGAGSADGAGEAPLAIPTSPAPSADSTGGCAVPTIYTRAKWRCPVRACSRVPAA